MKFALKSIWNYVYDSFITKEIKNHWPALLYLSIFFILATLLVLHRWWQLEVYYFDHGIFDQSLWHASRFNPPLIDHLRSEFYNQLGDHFTPSLYLLAPIYWFTSSYEILFVVMMLLVTLSGFVMYRMSVSLTKSRLMSFAILLAYTLFIGLQNGLIAGFHTEIPALLSLSLAFYFIEKKKWRSFLIAFFITLGFKEVFISIGLALAIYLAFFRHYKQAILVVVVSLVYYLTVVYLIIPSISGLPYYYGDKVSFPNSPQQLVTQLTSPTIKLKTMTITMLQFGGLPLLAIPVLPLLAQDFIARFVLAQGSHSWDLGMHYSIMSSLFAYFAAIKGVQWLKTKKWYQRFFRVHALLIICLALILHWRLHGPLGLTYNRSFYSHTNNLTFLRDFTDSIPDEGLVMTMNNLAVRLTHSHQVMLLREPYWEFSPDIIAIDTRDGQNPNNYWPTDVFVLDDRLAIDPNYSLISDPNREQKIYQVNDQVDMSFYERYYQSPAIGE